MKPHKHCELIKAWADGAAIQIKWHNTNPNGPIQWRDEHDPIWSEHCTYRIKPRNFEVGERYPVITANTGQRYIAMYECINGEYSFALGSYNYKEEYFSWIGEKLNIEWPEGA